MTEKSIITPIPGVFYRKPSPTEPEFVLVGQKVKAGDTLCLVEVMKNFYEVKAEDDGVLVEFLASDEEVVEAGQNIAILKTQ